MRIYYSMPIINWCLLSVILISALGCSDRTTKKNYGAPTDMVIDSNFKVNYLNVHYYALRVCLKCHDQQIGPSLSTYSSLVNHIEAVSDQVTSDDMPPQSEGYDQLTACQKLVLSTWKAAGMPKKNGTTLGAPGNACY